MTGPDVRVLAFEPMDDGLAATLAAIESWGAGHAAAAVIGPGGEPVTHGDRDHRFRWASVTKLVTAWAVLIAAERGRLSLDEAAGPPDSTVRHLLAHTSGLAFEGQMVLAAPGRRRIYSNPGYDELGRVVARRAGMPFEAVITSTVLEPLGMSSTVLLDRPSQGLHGTLADLIALARELRRPTLLSAEAATLATTVAYPGIPGVVPGVGNFDPCDWGLGPELHDGKRPHWMGTANSPAAFGHFGGAGTFVWVDPAVDLALVVLTDREFGPWALDAWPRMSDAVIGAIRR